jgi:hypothetical protein
MSDFTPEYQAIIQEYERKLSVCARWMERQVKEEMFRINRRRQG